MSCLHFSERTKEERATYETALSLSPTRFSLSIENEQTDAGGDGRTRLARLNSQARAEILTCLIPSSIPCSADDTRGSYMTHTLLKVLAIP